MFQVGRAALAVALMLALAGCSGPVVDAESSPATLPDEALEGSAYLHQDTRAVPLTYRAGGVIPLVSAQTWASVYVNPTGDTEPPILLLYSSPNRKVAGLSLNPTNQLSNRELVGFALERVTEVGELGGLSGIEELEVSEVTNVTVLGQPTELVTYTGTAAMDGDPVSIEVNLAVVEHEDDVVLAMGLYRSDRDERQAQATLVQRIIHETE